MSRRVNTFSGGTDGAAVTVANSTGGGNAFDLVATSSGAVVNYSTTIPGGGDVAAVFTSTATAGSARVGWTSSVGSVPLIYGVAYIYLTAIPAAEWRFAQHLADGTSRASLIITTAGQVQIVDTNGNRAGGNRSTTVLPLNTLVRVEWRIELNSTGQASLRIYSTATSTTATESITGPATNFGGNANQHYFGIPSPVASVGPQYLSAVGVSDTDWIGPDLTPSNTVPDVAAFTAYTRYSWGDPVTLVATIADPDTGATHSNVWTLTSRPADSTLTINATTDIVTVAPDRPGTYTARITATDDLGASQYAEVTFTVVPTVYLKVNGVEVPARIYGASTAARVGSGLVGTSTITA